MQEQNRRDLSVVHVHGKELVRILKGYLDCLGVLAMRDLIEIAQLIIEELFNGVRDSRPHRSIIILTNVEHAVRNQMFQVNEVAVAPGSGLGSCSTSSSSSSSIVQY